VGINVCEGEFIMEKNIIGDIAGTLGDIFDAIVDFLGNVFDFLFGWIF